MGGCSARGWRRLILTCALTAWGCGDEPASDAGGGGAVAPRAMIAVHVDPDSPSGGVGNATPEHWARLVDLVGAAERHGFRLTLMMGTDWPAVVEAQPNGVTTVAAWLEAGHQLGYHHHSCGHTHPDGYRDVSGPNRCGGEADRGSVRDAFSTVVDLAAAAVEAGAPAGAAVVDIAAQGPNDQNRYRSVEWQPEARHATGPSAENGDGHADHRFITQPRCVSDYGNAYEGSPRTFEVAELGHAQLDVGNFTTSQSSNNLTALEQEADLVVSGDHRDSGVVLGVVLHAREYEGRARATSRDSFATDRAYIDAIFQALADRGFEVHTARRILDDSDPCGG